MPALIAVVVVVETLRLAMAIFALVRANQIDRSERDRGRLIEDVRAVSLLSRLSKGQQEPAILG
jgi:hypothetical protein